VGCAVVAEDPAADTAMVPPHEDRERCLAFVAGFAFAVIHPKVFSRRFIPSDRRDELAKQALHSQRNIIYTSLGSEVAARVSV
jgi:hypothetical protein